jgi:hypothetical protein
MERVWETEKSTNERQSIMKKEMILTCAVAVAALVGCSQADHSRDVNEPAGSSRSDSKSTLDMSRTNSSFRGGSSLGTNSGSTLNEPSGAQKSQSLTNSSSSSSSGATGSSSESSGGSGSSADAPGSSGTGSSGSSSGSSGSSSTPQSNP